METCKHKKTLTKLYCITRYVSVRVFAPYFTRILHFKSENSQSSHHKRNAMVVIGVTDFFRH